MTTDTRVPLVSATGLQEWDELWVQQLPNVLGNLVRIRRKQCYYYNTNRRLKSGGSGLLFLVL